MKIDIKASDNLHLRGLALKAPKNGKVEFANSADSNKAAQLDLRCLSSSF